MPRTGVIGGTIFFENKLIEEPEKKTVKTPYGSVDVFVKDNLIFIPRHGIDNNIPPHKINYRAYIYALKELGVKNIIAAGSSGCLNKEITLPAIAVPSDYINFHDVSTFHDDKIIHITPNLNDELRQRIIKAAKEININIINDGVYIETKGPRIETKAEVNMLKNFGDFVGMTCASEATLAKEFDIKYAFIVSLDNYGNGLVEKELKYEEIKENAAKNSGNIKKLILETIKLIN